MGNAIALHLTRPWNKIKKEIRKDFRLFQLLN